MPEGRRLRRIQMPPDAGHEAPRKEGHEGISRGGKRSRSRTGLRRSQLVQRLTSLPRKGNVPSRLVRGHRDIAVTGNENSSGSKTYVHFISMFSTVRSTKKTPKSLR